MEGREIALDTCTTSTDRFTLSRNVSRVPFVPDSVPLSLVWPCTQSRRKSSCPTGIIHPLLDTSSFVFPGWDNVVFSSRESVVLLEARSPCCSSCRHFTVSFLSCDELLSDVARKTAEKISNFSERPMKRGSPIHCDFVNPNVFAQADC